MSTRRSFPAIPRPTQAASSLQATAEALKEAVDLLTGQRAHGLRLRAAVTWQDLVDVGVIKLDQVPRDRAG